MRRLLVLICKSHPCVSMREQFVLDVCVTVCATVHVSSRGMLWLQECSV